MKILFMGTPDFSVPVLEALIQATKHEVIAVVTQPDKPRGRSGKLSFSPIKEVAVRENIPVLQPKKIREALAVEALKKFDFDVAVVVAFGQILSKEILDLPKYGCVNIHASLLPKYRGAGPIQWAILDGEKETGVTTMQMDEGMDTGDILMRETFPLTGEETGGSLFEKLSALSPALLMKTLDGLEAGTIEPQKQKDEDSIYAKKLTKELGNLDFTKSAVELERYVRGLNPWPSAYTKYKDRTMKIWRAEASTDKKDAKPGEIVEVTADSFSIQTGDGSLKIYEVQIEGKRRMAAGDFLRGMKLTEGEMVSMNG